VAHRTSPTNIGLALLANFSAYDFGYIQAGKLVDRTTMHAGNDGAPGAPQRALLQLVRHANPGPLLPRYISTVDSGNLAGHLLTLRAGLLALLDDSILPAQVFSGLSDTFEILADSIDGVAAGSMAEFRKELASAGAALPRNLPADRLSLVRLAAISGRLVTQVAGGFKARPDSGEFADMDYDFLYDKARHLLTIGYNVAEHAGWIPATTTCWPPKRACATSSPLPRATAAGKLVRARPPAHRRPAASRRCCRGAARCSST
jgi:hypothetical protein